jgi:hypothetical protein
MTLTRGTELTGDGTQMPKTWMGNGELEADDAELAAEGWTGVSKQTMLSSPPKT